MEKVLEVNGLTKKYKNGRGIFDINLEINQGEIFGFLGPNGAGKTTAMKIMTGMMKPDEGDVKIFGCSVTNDFEKAMQHVGCIIEIAESYGYMTAFENMKLFARYYKGIDTQRIDEVLALTDILKFKNEKVKNFSLGMKQRLGIAASILSKPKLVILDEPLNGLDVKGMVEMRALIKGLAETDNTTFLISSHLIHDVELTCNKVGIIYGGKMLNVDYTENLLMNYASLENYYLSEVDRHGSL